MRQKVVKLSEERESSFIGEEIMESTFWKVAYPGKVLCCLNKFKIKYFFVLFLGYLYKD
jgi:hypothetical protein